MSTFGKAILAAATLCLLAACAATRIGQPVGTPVADPAAFAAELSEATVPPTPVHVTFGWDLDEGGSRVSGRGVVRVEAPDRIRLDLFGPRGETYLTAALVGEEYRFPTPSPPPVELPSPSLLWAALGVFNPPSGAALQGATRDSASAEIRYTADGGQLFVYSFSATAGDLALRRVERAGPRGVIETVSIEPSERGEIGTTSYRDWTAFRDLTLNVESIREEAAFPSNIWRPGAEPL